MKICIIGSGRKGLAMARTLFDLGAHVSVFHRNEAGGFAHDLIPHMSPELAAEWTQKTIDQSLLNWANEVGILRQGEVVRVHKRILNREQDFKNKSRLHDLFRVVYKADFSKDLHKQREENPELFEKLDRELVNSLQGTLENFDDFDIVINASGTLGQPKHAGPAGEKSLNEDLSHNFYGLEALQNIEQAKTHQKIVIVGSGMMAALAMLKLEDWLSADLNRELHVITTEVPPFAELKKEWPLLYKKVEVMIDRYYHLWLESTEKYRRDVHAWREMEEHLRVKSAMPQEPQSQLMIRPEFQLMAFDLLSDRNGIFVTAESIKENDVLVTIACDQVFVFTGHQQNIKLDQQLRTERNLALKGATDKSGLQPEPGYYLLSEVDQVPSVQNNILQFFSRVSE